MTTITIDKKWSGDLIKIQGKKVINKSSFETGLIVEGQAKLLAPKDTGHLAASITTQSKEEGTEPEYPMKYGKGSAIIMSASKMRIKKPNADGETYVGTPLEYAPYMEFGTVRTDAQPFLRPALDLALGKVLTIVRKFGKYYFGEYLR